MSTWTDRFDFPEWNLVGWCAIVALWLAWEFYGAVQTHNEGATFTYLIRNTVPKWGRWIAIVVLAWHFCFYDSKWWLNLLGWVKRTL